MSRKYPDMPARAEEVINLLGVSTLPQQGMPEQVIDGIRVFVRAKPTPLGGGMRGLRVIAICECGRHVPVGRLQQHRCKTAASRE